jgi:chemotaxis protein CheX
MSFQDGEKDGVHVITLPATVEVTEAAKADAMVKGWLLNPAKVFVLDMANVKVFKSSAYRSFVLFNQALKANNKNLYAVNVPTDIGRQFKADGLSTVFVPVASVDEAKKKASPKSAGVDVDFINPFIQAARAVLETQAQFTLTAGKPRLKKPDEQLPMEIACVIAMSCKEFTGSINLCFRGDTFLKIYEGLTGERHTQINSEIEDAAAEILNIIFGQAKTVLNDQKGYTLDRALPTVLSGDKLRLYHNSSGPVIVIPFESPAGPFHLEIVIERS